MCVDVGGLCGGLGVRVLVVFVEGDVGPVGVVAVLESMCEV